MLVAECDGYHALLKRGYDTNELKYYDATSGALVASVYQGLPCTGQPIAAPAGCTLGPFHRLADWCGAYAADGRPNAHCCELPATNRLPTWEGVHAAICPASTQAGECGAYHALIDCRPYDGVFGPDETWYYDAASGALTAVVDTASGVPICIAGPADGFVPPTCAPAFAPFCDQAGDGGTAARCPLVPNAGGSCTEDCSWDAVAAKTSYCCPIKGAINTSEALVAECQGYKVLLKRGLDAGVVKYYDATTGALVASATTGASPCGSEPIATPPGCTLGAFAKLPQWCQTDAAEACADGGI